MDFSKKYIHVPRMPVMFDGSMLNWLPVVRYLGIYLDKRLTFRHHLKDQMFPRLDKMIKSLYPFISRRSKLNVKCKLVLYKACFWGTMLYAHKVWRDCAKSHINALQRRQNAILKMMLNLPYFTSTREVHELAGIQMVSDRIGRSRTC